MQFPIVVFIKKISDLTSDIWTANWGTLTQWWNDHDSGIRAWTRISMKEGAGLSMGVATMVGGTITVNNVNVASTSRIFLTPQNTSGTAGSVYVSARTVGTSFTITSTNGSDTRDVAWLLVIPG